jgi:hypothetical protein
MLEDFCISNIALLRFKCNFIMAMNCIGRALDFSTWYVLYYLCDLSDNNDFSFLFFPVLCMWLVKDPFDQMLFSAGSNHFSHAQ